MPGSNFKTPSIYFATRSNRWSCRNQRFRLIAGAVGVARDEILENQCGFAAEDGIDGAPVVPIEFAQLEFQQDRAFVAQVCRRPLEYLLLFGLGPGPFFKTHDRKPRPVQRRHAVIGIDIKTWDRPGLRVAVARARQPRERIGHIVEAPGEETDVIERGTERVHAGARDRAEAGLEADNANLLSIVSDL
jgi:hypothetical protein